LHYALQEPARQRQHNWCRLPSRHRSLCRLSSGWARRGRCESGLA
jgi:hypothetical protein